MTERLTVADLHYKESLDMIKNKIDDMHYKQAIDIIKSNGCFKKWDLSCYNCPFGDAEINSVDDPEYCNPKKNLEKAKQFVKTYEQGWRYRLVEERPLTEKEDNTMKTEQEISDLYKLINTVTESELNKIIDKFNFDTPKLKKLFWCVTKEIAETKISIIEELENDNLD